MRSNLKFLISLFAITLFACGGNTSQSGADADSSTPALAGVYEGNEVISLLQTETSAEQDKIENEVTITINNEGLLRLSASNGSSGAAQIRVDRHFQMRSIAATQFGGLCNTGTILLDGQINGDSITGNYRSENLICDGVAFHITGELKARRN